MPAATGEVRFKEVSYKDLNPKTDPKETVSSNFQMQRISDFYYGWCAAAADINHDGVMDVIAGPFYFLGPDYTERGEFTAARTYNPSNQFTQGMVNFAYDFTGDGWPDILMVDHAADLSVCKPERRIAPLGPLQRRAPGDRPKSSC